MPRNFDGVGGGTGQGQWIKFASTSVATARNNANVTVAAVLRKTSDGSWYKSLLGGMDSGGVEQWLVEISDTDKMQMYNGSTEVLSPTITVKTTDGWVLVAWSRGSGTVAPRFHKYAFSTNAWTHENAASTLTNSSTPGSGGFLWTGAHRFGDNADWELAAMGVWAAALTDAQIESLAASLAQWLTAAPEALWLFDQSDSTMPVRDYVGGQHQSSTSSTAPTVGTTSPPISYGGALLDTVFTPAAGGSATNANADVASATGSAYNASGTAQPNAGSPQPTGTAQSPAAKVQPAAGNAAATGTASNPGTSASQPVGNAAATGTARTAAAKVQPSAGNASATGTAYNPTVDTAARADANAGNAAGTGTANNASTGTRQPSGSSSGAGVANQPGTKASQPATVAAAAGTSQAPTAKVAPNGGSPQGAGAAYNATAQTSSSGSASAQVASATGTANQPGTSARQPAGNATASGSAYAVTVSVSAHAGVATVIGQAHGPSIAVAVSATVAAATATAHDPTIQAGVIEVVVYDATGQVVYQASHAKEVFTADGAPVFGASGRLVSGRGCP